jgi:hypothetical protein
MPGVAGLQGEGSGDGMYYEWSYGPMHFAAMNSESPIDTALFTAQEMDWVNKKLAAVDRSVTPWSIAHFHRPVSSPCSLEVHSNVILTSLFWFRFTVHEMLTVVRS